MNTRARFLPGLEQAAHEMPFDQFGRYHMLREAVDACRSHLGIESLSILDVGGFYEDQGQPTLPSARILPDDRVTVLDVVDCDLPGYIKGDGTRLTFADGSFDLVVSADTLEHIPRPLREQFWQELLRVARHGVILLAPFGDQQVETAESLLFEYIRADLQAEHQQLKEHREYVLPRIDEWMAYLERQGRVARAYPTGYLHAWLGMMLIKHVLLRIDPGTEAQQMVDSYYNECFFPTERREPAYRYLIVVEQQTGLVEAVDAVLSPTILPPIKDTATVWDIGLIPSLLTVIERQLGNVADVHRRTQDHINTLTDLQRLFEGHFDNFRQEISTLERIMADQQIVIGQLQTQLAAAHQQNMHAAELVRISAEQNRAVVDDLTERSRWLEGQASVLREQLEAVRNGKVMRLLNKVSGKA